MEVLYWAYEYRGHGAALLIAHSLTTRQVNVMLFLFLKGSIRGIQFGLEFRQHN